MTVTAILKQKASAGTILTIKPEATIADSAMAMSEHRIGALVVSKDGQTIEGIISERDVVRVLAEQGAACLNKTVATVMTRNVETCDKAERSANLLRRMTAGRFRHMPVVEDGRMTALISIGDVVKYRISEMEMEKAALEDMIRGM
jgi:CBS domain-containing protein